VKPIQAVRALLSLGAGIYITFTQEHGAKTGLIALAFFGIGLAIFEGAIAFSFLKRKTVIEHVVLSITALLVGGFAAQNLIENNTSRDQAAQVFNLLVICWGFASGALELYFARQKGTGKADRRDRTITGFLTLALAVLLAAWPLDIVSAVGFFSAYLMITGVHLAISATTPAERGGAKKSAGKKSKS
jgi:uncharacterized membrane protein HdeD (DUF308 family)